MRGVSLELLEQFRLDALRDLNASRDRDFTKLRVTLSAATADALSRFLLLETLVTAAGVKLTDESKRGGISGRKGGTTRQENALDL